MATKFLIRIRVIKKKTDIINNRRHRSLQRRLSDLNSAHCSELWDKIQETVGQSVDYLTVPEFKVCRPEHLKYWKRLIFRCLHNTYPITIIRLSSPIGCCWLWYSFQESYNLNSISMKFKCRHPVATIVGSVEGPLFVPSTPPTLR